MVSLKLQGITRDFGEVRAVDDVSLEIGRGELFFLLGPSGCGKTTLLRLIAGFYAPSVGRTFSMIEISLGLYPTDGIRGWSSRTMLFGHT